MMNKALSKIMSKSIDISNNEPFNIQKLSHIAAQHEYIISDPGAAYDWDICVELGQAT